jgi:hypothetical protein
MMLPLTLFEDSIRSYFAAHEVPATVFFGWKHRARIGNQGPAGGSRVVLCPGLEPKANGAAEGGKLDRFTHGTGADPQRFGTPGSGAGPAAILNAPVQATLCVWGYDPAHRESEGHQHNAAWELFEHTLRAMHNATVTDDAGNTLAYGHGAIVWGAFRWTLGSLDDGFGKELLVELVHKTILTEPHVDLAYPQPFVQPRSPSPFVAAVPAPPLT